MVFDFYINFVTQYVIFESERNHIDRVFQRDCANESLQSDYSFTNNFDLGGMVWCQWIPLYN